MCVYNYCHTSDANEQPLFPLKYLFISNQRIQKYHQPTPIKLLNNCLLDWTADGFFQHRALWTNISVGTETFLPRGVAIARSEIRTLFSCCLKGKFKNPPPHRIEVENMPYCRSEKIRDNLSVGKEGPTLRNIPWPVQKKRRKKVPNNIPKLICGQSVSDAETRNRVKWGAVGSFLNRDLRANTSVREAAIARRENRFRPSCYLKREI